jgi:DNA polymerase III gamma and tau subunits C terminal
MDDVIRLAEEHREEQLAFSLKNHVVFQDISHHTLSIAIKQEAPATLLKTLTHFLQQNLDKTFQVITVPLAKDAQTVAEVKKALIEQEKQAASQDPVVESALSLFQGSEIIGYT